MIVFVDTLTAAIIVLLFGLELIIGLIIHTERAGGCLDDDHDGRATKALSAVACRPNVIQRRAQTIIVQ
jgi:hypothetical protein